MSVWINYYEYIKSPEWYQRTEKIRLRNKGRCEVCNMRRSSCVHHRTYAHLGNERDDELLSVCSDCHSMIHRKGKAYIWPSRVKLLVYYQEEADQLKCQNNNSEIDMQNGRNKR